MPSGLQAIHSTVPVLAQGTNLAVSVVNPPPTREICLETLHSFLKNSLEYFRIIQVRAFVRK